MISTKVIAHRGASGYAPENTITAFEMAIKINSDGIELDVHLSKDGELIVFHDEKGDRTSNGSGYIKDLKLLELKKLDAGSWFNKKYKEEKIPTLEEVLLLTKDKNMLINIELKNGIIDYNGLEEKIINLIHKLSISENIILSSFNHYSMLKVKDIDKNIKIGLLYVSNLINPWKYGENLGAFSLNPYYHTVNEDLVYYSNAHNIKLLPYTVNDEGFMKKIIKLNSYGLITNYPDIALKIKEEIILKKY